ncbi:SDR family oxidoreductase [Microvirga splendida]|uniref:SDR family oxidoreductase n=1 Tax=Microvirga splendida TaxID=2795727 RepID=A0ABS0Y803_9HYPH|nr:SDR family oxidoreductase [Microvirga splendida]MBJ6128439.1 SDR family oxidoreductase [Microvirga splendida]
MSHDPVHPLHGQKALVTGASSGIGTAIARAFAAAGAAVGVNYRSHADEAERIVQEIRDAGGEAAPLKADVSSEDEVRAMFDEFGSAFGRIDILVANSGIQQDAAFPDMTLDQWRRVIDVNLTGQFLCAREAVRRFLAQGPDPSISRAVGKIICMSSVHEVIPWAGHVNYAASKGGVMLMMKSLAQEVAQAGIRVNGIAPGAIKTPINQEAWQTPEAERKLLELIPYGRVGEPEDVGKAAVWLASDASDYVVGTTLFVDGGMTLYPSFRENG